MRIGGLGVVDMSVSDPLRLEVIRYSDGWRVLAPGGRIGGWFAYRVDAEEAAIRHARKARGRGRDVEVWVQDTGGHLQGLDAA
jgi:hypothetical protein